MISHKGSHDTMGNVVNVSAHEVAERERIERDEERADLARVASRPYRIIHELPRKHTTNGYAFDV